MALIIMDKGVCAGGCQMRLRWNHGLVERYCTGCGRATMQLEATEDLERDIAKQEQYQCPCGALAPHRSDRECREDETTPKLPTKRRIVMP